MPWIVCTFWSNRVFVLTYTTLPDQAAGYRETFARSARSFAVR